MKGSKSITSRRHRETAAPAKTGKAAGSAAPAPASSVPREYAELAPTRQEMESLRARYFELFDLAPVAYFTISTRGIIEGINMAAAELLRIDRQQVAGTPAASFFTPESRPTLHAHLEHVLQEPGTHAVDLMVEQPPGRRHVHVVSRLIHGEAGNPLCLSAAVDITERKQAEEEISRLNAALEQRVAQRTLELEESNKDLEAFIYSISHDLRAPLRNMAGFASIITEEYGQQVPPEVQGFVKRILAGNEKMLNLVDDLLRFSRLGRKPLEVANTDLNELLEDALADLGSEMVGRDIQWHRHQLPTAECDPGLMRQVFVNFLSNALKYTRPRRPAVIRISCEPRGSERVIVIQDNGVGFDMRYVDKLFGVFQRLHVPSEFEGNGVGLAMVARILHRHGGHAGAEGRVGEGATFWFTFEGLRPEKYQVTGIK